MTDKALTRGAHTVQIDPRRRLIAGVISVAIVVVRAVVAWVDDANGIPFRIIWDLVCARPGDRLAPRCPDE